MSSLRSYIRPVEIGEVMRGMTAGVVVESRHADYSVGTQLTGWFGWQDYAVGDGRQVRRAIEGVPLQAMLGVLGLTGLTARWLDLLN